MASRIYTILKSMHEWDRNKGSMDNIRLAIDVEIAIPVIAKGNRYAGIEAQW